MLKKKPSKIHKLILFFLMILFLGGTTLVLNQNGNRQNTKSEAAGDCTVSNVQMQRKLMEQHTFELVNAYRAEKGVAALSWSDDLKKPAAWMSSEMVRTKVLSHTDSLGRNTNVRLPDCGVSIIPGYGETIASGPPSGDEVVAAWKASPTHNQILLNPNYQLAAIAMEVDATGQNAYWTMDFTGTPLNYPSLTPTSGVNVPSPSITSSITAVPTTTLPTATVAPSSTIAPTDSIVPTNANPTPTTGPTTVDMQIAVKVKISGIGKGGNIYPKRLSRPVKVFVYAPGSLTPITGTGFGSYDANDYFNGTIHLGKMNEGIYLVKVVSESSLQALVKPEFQLLKAGKVNQLAPVTLYQGDITQDNVLSIDDYNLALACFQFKRCDSKEMIDFNDDGLTDITDYNILLRSFGESRGN